MCDKKPQFTIDTSFHKGSRSVAISASANYNVWTLIIKTVAIRSHNCLLTPIVGEGNGAVKVANNGTIVQMAGCNCKANKLAAPPYLSLFLLTQTHQVNI